MAQVEVGTYDGTGAAINISLGWIPAALIIVNAEDGDVIGFWFDGMGSGDFVQGTNHADTQFSLVTSNGITRYTGSNTPGSEAAPGFTVGTTLSESGKTFYYIAVPPADI